MIALAWPTSHHLLAMTAISLYKGASIEFQTFLALLKFPNSGTLGQGWTPPSQWGTGFVGICQAWKEGWSTLLL